MADDDIEAPAVSGDAAAPEGANAEIDDVERAFKKFDDDNSGAIDSKELMVALREVGIEVAEAVARKVLAGYDTDKSGVMELDEFRKVVIELRAYQAEQAAKEPAKPADDVEVVFLKFDANRSGDIDLKELGNALRELGIDLETSQAQQVLSTFDADKSGALQLAEFRKVVKTLRDFQARGEELPKGKDVPRIAALHKVVNPKAYLPRFKSKKA